MARQPDFDRLRAVGQIENAKDLGAGFRRAPRHKNDTPRGALRVDLEIREERGVFTGGAAHLLGAGGIDGGVGP